MRIAGLLIVALLIECTTACAPTRGRDPVLQTVHHDLARQRAEVTQAVAAIETKQSADLKALDQATPDADVEPRVEALVRDYRKSLGDVLTPLAKQGNAEAMMRLADEVRDGSSREDVTRWLSLVSRAAELGHPIALDEMVRWHWHQRGDSSITFVQGSRARALEFADRAAAAGNMYAIHRIGGYIFGEVHQYPAAPDLGRRVIELCARTDYDICQELLVRPAPAGYSVPPVEAHLWLSRLAKRHPERFTARRDAGWDQLTPAQQLEARRTEANWRPATWPELHDEWRDLEGEILRRGATSIGPDAPCTTPTPWCRGALAARVADPDKMIVR
jgi:hypothetical protein